MNKTKVAALKVRGIDISWWILNLKNRAATSRATNSRVTFGCHSEQIASRPPYSLVASHRLASLPEKDRIGYPDRQD